MDLRGTPASVAVDGAWHARGLRAVAQRPVELRRRAGHRRSGSPGWYLHRDGFAWGGIGVAAVWYGGAVGRRPPAAAPGARPRRPTRSALLHLGRGRHRARTARARRCADAAVAVDAGAADGAAGALLALRVRQVVADAAERVLDRGRPRARPGPLAVEAEHAARVADLRLYLRQHHAERDTAALGGAARWTPDDGRGLVTRPRSPTTGPAPRPRPGATTRPGARCPSSAWSTTGACTRLVVVAAHPDDESLGAGGLIAAARAAGLAVYVVLLTAGEGSPPRLAHP